MVRGRDCFGLSGRQLVCKCGCCISFVNDALNYAIIRGAMSEKRINNSIFIMFLLSGAYCTAHNISTQEFLALDDKYAILNYIAECPDVFDSMTEEEMVKEIDEYVKGV